MSQAYETTEEDVQIVLRMHHTIMEKEDILEMIENEDDRLTKAALAYTDLDDQTVSVFDEIENILIEDEVLPDGTKKKFRAP